MSKAGANINECQVKECSYNINGKCRTIGINVGGPEPLCDTFINAGVKGGLLNAMAKVGACKVQSCRHNALLECTVEGILVTLQQNRAMCASYQSRA
jgi:hypothetical protein